ncbi:hypothetical protein AAVH_20470 [Aphelenchoides avenae]|nr:hypothetical protein AAVH_20470 [Aphelenchus avenae]
MKETSVMSVLQLQAASQRCPSPEASLIPACIQSSLRFAVAANRCQNLRNFGSPMQYENRPACKETVVKAFWSELRVLKDYFCGLGDDFYSLLRDDATPAVLSQSFIMEWSLFETALSTLVNEGQRKRHMHFVDHSLVELDETGLSKFYGSDRQISDLPDVVRFCLERYGRFIEFVKRLEKAALDDVEQTGLMQLVFAQCLPHMFESLETRAKFVNKTLVELHKHYKSTYADYVGRLDALLTLLGPFMELRHAFEEMGVFIELHSRPKTGNVVILSTRFQIVHKYFEPLEPEKGFYI